MTNFVAVKQMLKPAVYPIPKRWIFCVRFVFRKKSLKIQNKFNIGVFYRENASNNNFEQLQCPSPEDSSPLKRFSIFSPKRIKNNKKE
jgi:hypothetical protein